MAISKKDSKRFNGKLYMRLKEKFTYKEATIQTKYIRDQGFPARAEKVKPDKQYTMADDPRHYYVWFGEKHQKTKNKSKAKNYRKGISQDYAKKKDRR